jgi:hypothetical protein
MPISHEAAWTADRRRREIAAKLRDVREYVSDLADGNAGREVAILMELLALERTENCGIEG